MEEELIQSYYFKIVEGKTPQYHLCRLYCEIQEIDFDSNKKLIGMFGKAVKVYGREVSFQATIDTAFLADKPEHPEALFFYFCKKKYADLVESRNAPVLVDLKKEAEEREKSRVPIDREWLEKIMTME
jgi:hypothetical protein